MICRGPSGGCLCFPRGGDCGAVACGQKETHGRGKAHGVPDFFLGLHVIALSPGATARVGGPPGGRPPRLYKKKLVARWEVSRGEKRVPHFCFRRGTRKTGLFRGAEKQSPGAFFFYLGGGLLLFSFFSGGFLFPHPPQGGGGGGLFPPWGGGGGGGG